MSQPGDEKLPKLFGTVPYNDIHTTEETKRWDLIASECVKRAGKEIAVITDSEPADKADLYIREIQKRNSAIKVVKRFNGPTPGAVSVIFRYDQPA